MTYTAERDPTNDAEPQRAFLVTDGEGTFEMMVHERILDDESIEPGDTPLGACVGAWRGWVEV